MKKPILIESPLEFIELRKQFQNKSVGFVPTMGALHEGHATLLRQARKENDLVILSIFVNPTQFNDANDYSKYPQTFSTDLKLAEETEVDYIFTPSEKQMYPDNYQYRLTENNFSKILCGEHRPGHFDGVLTVVMKLFHIVKPTKAYFGEKDFQQLNLIQNMVSSFFMDVQIIPVATVRENDGLAMSSRNKRLSEKERLLAAKIYQLSSSLISSEEVKAGLNKLGFEVDYVKDIKNRRFIAAKLGDVRLIDNVEI